MRNSKSIHGNERGSDGFSLIELMVVIAIIAILATMLFPAIGTAVGLAQRTNSQAILKTVGLAINSYALERGEMPRLYIRQRIERQSSPGRLLSDIMHGEYGEAIDPNITPQSLYDEKFADAVGASGRADVSTYKSKYRYITHQWDQKQGGKIIDDFPFKTPGKTQGTPNAYSLENVREPSSTWAVSEVDWEFMNSVYPRAPGSSVDFIPEPLHENVRCAVFFDAHTEAIRNDEMSYYDQLSYP